MYKYLHDEKPESTYSWISFERENCVEEEFVVLDLQNSSQIVRNKNKIEWRKKTHIEKCVKDGWVMRERRTKS